MGNFFFCGGGGGLIIRWSFALHKWLGLHLEGILRVKMLREKECRYKVQELNFLANTICMLSRNKYKDGIRNAVRREQ